MNTATNQFEQLSAEQVEQLTKAPGQFIPFDIGEEVVVKNYRFKIVRVSTNRLHLEPVGVACYAGNARSDFNGERK